MGEFGAAGDMTAGQTSAVSGAPTAGRRGGLLRERNFRLFWAGESISTVGNSVTIA